MSRHKVVLGEHAKLEVLLRDLGTVSRWDPELLRDAKVRLKLTWDLQFLKVRLLQHFDTEESGSYLEEIRSRKPKAADALKALQAEHPMILELISSLEAASQSEDEATDTLQDLLRKLSWLLDVLKLHENKENALIKDVFQN